MPYVIIGRSITMVKQIKKIIGLMILTLMLAVIAEVSLVNARMLLLEPETVYWEQFTHHSDENYLLNLARPRFNVQPDKHAAVQKLIGDAKFYGHPEVVKFSF